MEMKKLILNLSLAATLIILIGCSSSGSPMMPDPVAEPDGGISGLSPEKEANLPQDVEQNYRVIWGVWTLDFDIETGDITATPVRISEAHYNVTSFVTPPACPDCIGITIEGYNPDGWVYDIRVTLRNPTQLTGRDVRGTLLIGHEVGKRKLVNADEYTELFDNSTPPDRNPFKWFATDQPGRKFEPDAVHEVLYQISFPPPPKFNVLYVVDASWPGNQKEPSRIYDQEISPDLDDAGVNSAEAVAYVQDWQGDVEYVKLDVTPLGAPEPIDLEHIAGDIWRKEITNEWGAAEGEYELWLEAKSEGNNVKLYDKVTATIVPYVNTPPVWDTTVGITGVVPGNELVIVTYGTASDPQMPITYVVYYSETSPINFGEASTVESDIGSPTVVPGLVNDKTYHFAVRARDSWGLEDDNTNELAATPTYDNQPPEWDTTIGITGAVPGNELVIVTYGTASDPDMPITYVVYYSETSPINFGEASTVESDVGSPTTVNGLINEQTYYFAVRARDALGLEDDNTNELPATPHYDNQPPVWDGPVGVQSLTPLSEAMEVHFGSAIDPDLPVTYNIYCSETSPIDFGQPPAANVSESPGVIDGLDNSKTYYFAVRAMDGLGLEEENTVELAGCPNLPPTWDTTIGIQGLTPLSGSVEVTFGTASDPDTPVTYNIYCSLISPIDFGMPPKENVSSSPAVISGLDNGLTYHFAVRAMDGLGLEDDNTNEMPMCPNLPPTWDTTVGIQGLTPMSEAMQVEFGTASDPDTPVTYNVYYSLNSPIDFGNDPKINVPGSPALVGGLSDAETYHFAVRARDVYGLEDGNTIEMSGCPNLPPVWQDTIGIIDAVAGFDFAVITFGTATDPDTPVTYNIYYSEISPIDFGGANKIMGVTSSPYKVEDLEHDKTFHFAVRTQDSLGMEDTNTNEASAHIWALPEEKWSIPFGGVVFSSPNYADVNGDGMIDIIVGGWNGKVKALNGLTGGEIWSMFTWEWFDSSPCLVNIYGSAVPDAIAGCYDGNVYCIDGETGAPAWYFPTSGAVSSSPAACDIDNDGNIEIVIGSMDGYIYAIKHDGTEEWKVNTVNSVFSSPALCDWDNDGLYTIFIGSRNGFLYSINHSGGTNWAYPTGGAINSSPAVGDIDDDGEMEVVFASCDGYVYALTMAGGLEWQFDIGGYIYTSPALGDVNGDGALDVAMGADNRNFYLIDGKTGTEIWNFPSGNRIWSSAAVVDMSGDGVMDVVVGSNDGYLWCIDGVDGTELWHYYTGAWIDSSPAVVDLDHDGDLEIIFGCANAFVYCIESHAMEPDASLYVWPKFRKSIDNRGAF